MRYKEIRKIGGEQFLLQEPSITVAGGKISGINHRGETIELSLNDILFMEEKYEYYITRGGRLLSSGYRTKEEAQQELDSYPGARVAKILVSKKEEIE
jgi:hypothetical protein